MQFELDLTIFSLNESNIQTNCSLKVSQRVYQALQDDDFEHVSILPCEFRILADPSVSFKEYFLLKSTIQLDSSLNDDCCSVGCVDFLNFCRLNDVIPFSLRKITIKPLKQLSLEPAERVSLNPVEPLRCSLDLLERKFQEYFDSSHIVHNGQVIHFVLDDKHEPVALKITEIQPQNGNTTFWQFTKDKSLAILDPTKLSPSEWNVKPDLNSIGSCLTSYVKELEHVSRATYFYQKHVARIGPILLCGPEACGKTSVARHVASSMFLHFDEIDSSDLSCDTTSASEEKISQTLTKAMKNKAAFILLRNIDLLCKNKAGNQDQSRLISYFGDLFRQTQKGLSCILVATARKKSSLPEKLASFFPHTICMDALDDDSRLNVILYWKRVCQSLKEWNVDSLVRQSGGWKLTDFSLLFAEAKLESFQRLGKKGIDVDDADLQKAMGYIRKKRGAAFGFPKVPDVDWSDIGGLERVKKDIMDTIELPLRHPELFPEDLQRSGLLLFGPPGTGKTLLAKAVARQCSLNFISVKGPEILNMYVGQSEENLREIFARARRAAPCVIFFDELDSIAPNRGRSGQSGGVMDSVVAQLLAELDGIHKNSRVFVIGATNRPDLLDPSLLRPGRFDKQINVGISKTKEEQFCIVRALTRKFNMAPDVSLEEIVSKCPMNFSGADFYALCSNAMMNSVRKMIQSEEPSSGILIGQDDFIKALAQVNRSLE